ncbi:hypothetical protein [Shewanella subflava]|uniref:Uncharacterized protein n=1 Tax=Shewanella subflava TaxID=2986476 RepID=A0ABT3I7T2_9GAMM|nr:hypothetical protein [Shewanella subflava]MCW3172044.1 hypothetical protein [Shewanella subflava]
MDKDNKLQSLNDNDDVITRGHGGLVKPIAVAIVIHIILFGILGLFWQQSHQQRKDGLVTPQAALKINSYIITTEQYEAMVNAANSNKENIDDKPHKTLNDIPAQQLNTQPDLEKPTIIVPTAIESDDKGSIANEAEVTDKAIPQNKAPPTEPKDEQSNTLSRVDKSSAAPSNLTSEDIRRASRHFLQQINEQEFDAMVGRQTASISMVGTMSEMDADRDYIEIHQKQDLSQPHSYNHRLDPNRIVKQGDYCYRVVNLATQVNPYGEGLGFAEFCGTEQLKIAMQ